MGKTTKGGKSLNPTDAYRKELRKKELKKNKKQRDKVREQVLQKKDPLKIKQQILKLDELDNEGKLDKRLKVKKKQLQDTYETILKRKQDAEKEKGVTTTTTVNTEFPNSIEMFANPQESIYYHPTLNPFGVPPPGAPVIRKPIPPPFMMGMIPPLSVVSNTTSTSTSSDSDEELAPPGAEVRPTPPDDIPLPAGPPPDIPLPPGPPPVSIPLPAGPPPGIPLPSGPPPTGVKPLPPGPPPPKPSKENPNQIQNPNQIPIQAPIQTPIQPQTQTQTQIPSQSQSITTESPKNNADAPLLPIPEKEKSGLMPPPPPPRNVHPLASGMVPPPPPPRSVHQFAHMPPHPYPLYAHPYPPAPQLYPPVPNHQHAPPQTHPQAHSQSTQSAHISAAPQIQKEDSDTPLFIPPALRIQRLNTQVAPKPKPKPPPKSTATISSVPVVRAAPPVKSHPTPTTTTTTTSTKKAAEDDAFSAFMEDMKELGAF